jgi:hypothetical protein
MRSSIHTIAQQALLALSATLPAMPSLAQDHDDRKTGANAVAQANTDTQASGGLSGNSEFIDTSKAYFSLKLNDRKQSVVHFVSWDYFDPIVSSDNVFDPQSRGLCALISQKPSYNFAASVNLDDPRTRGVHEGIEAISKYILEDYLPNNPEVLNSIGAARITNLTPRQAIWLSGQITKDRLNYSTDHEDKSKLVFNDALPISQTLKYPAGDRGNGVCRNYSSIAIGILEALKYLQEGSSLNSTYLLDTRSIAYTNGTAIPGQPEQHAWVTAVVFGGENQTAVTIIDDTWDDNRESRGNYDSRFLNSVWLFKSAHLVETSDLIVSLLDKYQSMTREPVFTQALTQPFLTEDLLPLRTNIAHYLLQIYSDKHLDSRDFSAEFMALAKQHLDDINERFLAVEAFKPEFRNEDFDSTVLLPFLSNYLDLARLPFFSRNLSESIPEYFREGHEFGISQVKGLDPLFLRFYAYHAPIADLSNHLKECLTNFRNNAEGLAILASLIEDDMLSPDRREIIEEILASQSDRIPVSYLADSHLDNTLGGETIISTLLRIKSKSAAHLNISPSSLSAFKTQDALDILGNIEAFFTDPSRKDLLRFREVSLTVSQPDYKKYSSIKMPVQLFKKDSFVPSMLEDLIRQTDAAKTMESYYQNDLKLRFKNLFSFTFNAGDYAADNRLPAYAIIEELLAQEEANEAPRGKVNLRFLSYDEGNFCDALDILKGEILDEFTFSPSRGVTTNNAVIKERISLKDLGSSGYLPFLRVKRGHSLYYFDNEAKTPTLRNLSGSRVTHLNRGDTVYMTQDFPSFYDVCSDSIYIDPRFDATALRPAISQALQARRQIRDIQEKMRKTNACEIAFLAELSGPMAHSPVFIARLREISDQFTSSWQQTASGIRQPSSVIHIGVGQSSINLSTDHGSAIRIAVDGVSDVSLGLLKLKEGLDIREKLMHAFASYKLSKNDWDLLAKVSISERHFEWWRTICSQLDYYGKLTIKPTLKLRSLGNKNKENLSLIKLAYDVDTNEITAVLRPDPANSPLP